MNKTQFTQQLAKECGLSYQKALKFLNTSLDMIQAELQAGGSISFRGFGKFFCAEYNRDNLVTPQGDTMDISSRNLPKFKSSITLKRELNN